ncbi:MAG: DUF4377 domain-containing protein [Candidatus Thiodiazotropha sp.]
MRLITIVFVILATSLVGCNSDSKKGEIIEIFVDHYKSECSGSLISLCLRVRSSREEEWSQIAESIGGFEYAWGYNYKLKVLATDIKNPPEDGSAQKYTLLEILSKELEPISATFDIAASRSSGLVIQKSSNIYELYGEKEFYCSVHQSLFLSYLLAQDLAILFEFRHATPPNEPMRLSQLKCSASREAFRDSCL